MTDETAVVAKPIDATGELYQQRALRALPILVRQAWAGRPILYGEIAQELGMPNPRNMNYVLGSVGTSLQILSAKWNERIPPLQVLAINVSAGLPGEGFAEFTNDPEAFKRAPLYQRRRTIEALTAQVRAYPWGREEALINAFGLKRDGTGILANHDRYAQSSTVDGVELRKYVADGNVLPSNFHSRYKRLRVGRRQPRNPRSVYGKICEVLRHHPGVTGERLVELLQSVDFSDNASAYTQAGCVSLPWLAKYIDGGFYRKNQCIQEYEPG